LSFEQQKYSPIWRRHVEVYPDAIMTSSLLFPESVVQDIVTDCSVCTSIAVSVGHHRRFGSKVTRIPLIIHKLFPESAPAIIVLHIPARFQV
jgi:hypothetical protein